MIVMKKIIFVMCYYFVWFSCIYLGTINQPYMALLLSCIISSFQIKCFIHKNNYIKLIKWMTILTAIGFFIDSIWAITGILIFTANPWFSYLAPPWILGLWINFSVLCYFIKGLLIKYIRYLPIVALVQFPVAYLGGAQFGGVIIPSYSNAIMLLGGVWFFIFPITIFFLKGRTADEQ